MQRRDFNQTSISALGALMLTIYQQAHALSLGELAGISQADASAALKTALEKSAVAALALLGKSDGFLGNPKVRIPLPGFLGDASQFFRNFGQGKRIDALVEKSVWVSEVTCRYKTSAAVLDGMNARWKRALVCLCAGAVGVVLQGCSPSLNWRQVRPEGTDLALLLPCKPDKTKKSVPLGGSPTLLSMLGCNASGVTFAVASAPISDVTKVAEILAQWQKLSLTHIHALPTLQIVPIKVTGAAPGMPAVLVTAQGRRADGTSVWGQAAYFAQGTQVFQVVLYADKLMPEASETFFSSLHFETAQAKP